MPPTAPHRNKRLWGFLGILSLAVAIAAALISLGYLQEIESRSWDWRLRWAARRAQADPNIKIIVIDQSSLDHFSNSEKIVWPWPRAIYEAVVRFLAIGKARGVAFDILFTEPSSYGVEDDQSFASAVREGIPVVSAIALRLSQSGWAEDERFHRIRRHQEQSGTNRIIRELFLGGREPHPFNGATMPVSELVDASAAFGNVSAFPDSDGVFRHTVPGAALDGTAVLGLPFALYAVTHEERELPNLSRFLDQDGQFAVRFRGAARSFPTLSISSIIASYQLIQEGKEPIVDPKIFDGSYVFVGMDAPGLLDLRPTPLAEVFPGVEYNATVLDNLLHNDFALKAGMLTNLIFTAAAVGVATAIALFFSSLWVQLLLLASSAAVIVAVPFLAADAGLWLQLTVPVIVATLATIAGFAFQFQIEGRQHRFIKNAFRHYVSPSVIDRIVDEPGSLALGGERRELTIFFSDIAGFTSLSESMEASKLVPLLNEFLSAMTDIIQSHGGTVDKYVGDAIVAFWNAPLAVPDHAAQAVRAALACQRRLREMEDHFTKSYGAPLRMRIGLNTGVVSVGNFGSRDRFNYTVIGDAANLASRLEGANKYFGTNILISGSTFNACREVILARKVADIKVVGRSEAVSTYQPLQQGESQVIFEEAMRHFEAGELTDAQKLFTRCEGDPVAQVYLRRLERALASDGKRVGSSWNSAWELTEK